MQEAHLYGAIFLVNQGIDQAVRGMERLKKAPGFADEVYKDSLATVEHARTQASLQYFADVKQTEKRDAARHDHRTGN